MIQNKLLPLLLLPATICPGAAQTTDCQSTYQVEVLAPTSARVTASIRGTTRTTTLVAPLHRDHTFEVSAPGWEVEQSPASIRLRPTPAKSAEASDHWTIDYTVSSRSTLRVPLPGPVGPHRPSPVCVKMTTASGVALLDQPVPTLHRKGALWEGRFDDPPSFLLLSTGHAGRLSWGERWLTPSRLATAGFLLFCISGGMWAWGFRVRGGRTSAEAG